MISFLLRLAVACPDHECKRNLVINSTDELRTELDNCRTDLCGSEIIGSWNVSQVDSLEGAFQGGEYTFLNLTGWGDQIGNASLNSLFEVYQGENVSIANWDVSNVEEMDYMFAESQFNSDISAWNVGNVVTMEGMFAFSQFNSNISGWNVGKVVNMVNMFRSSQFNSNISGWNVSNVESMADMFAFSQFNSDISGWNVSNVVKMAGMFKNSAFKGNISSWGEKLTNNTQFKEIFFNSTISCDLSSWPVSDGQRPDDIREYYGIKNYYSDSCLPGSAEVCRIEETLVATPEDLRQNILDCSTEDCGTVTIQSWNVSMLDRFDLDGQGPFENKAYTFLNLTGWGDQIGNASLIHLFHGYQGENVSIANWDVSNVKDMSSMFIGSRFNSDISAWNVGKVESMDGMFRFSQFNSNISGWNVGNVKSMGSMFAGSQFNSDISGWNVSNVESMAKMFFNSTFEGDISSWGEKLTGIDKFEDTFFNAAISCDLSSWPDLNASLDEIRDYYGIAEEYPDSCLPGSGTLCEVIFTVSQLHDSIDACITDDCGAVTIQSWNVSRLDRFDLDGRGPFENKEYTFLNLTGWGDQIGDASLSRLFQGYQGEDVSIADWEVGEVTNIDLLFKGSAFNGNISAWDVGKVKSMNQTFSTSAFNADISDWNVSSVLYMYATFSHSSFEGDISSWGEKLRPEGILGMFVNATISCDLSSWPDLGLPSTFVRAFYGIAGEYPDSCLPGNGTLCEVIFTVSQLHDSIDACSTDDCGAMTIQSWNVSRLDRFDLDGRGPFDNKTYSFLNLTGWGDQIGDASLEHLFQRYNGTDGDISNWDVSNVKNMAALFTQSTFNPAIPNWNVRNVEDMSIMFFESAFNSDISSWKVSSVKFTSFMFYNSQFKIDISGWILDSLLPDHINNMFNSSIIECDLSSWPDFGYSVSDARAAYGLRSDYPDGCVPGSNEVCRIGFLNKRILTAEELRQSVLECNTDECGERLIGSWDVSALDRFYWENVNGNKFGPFYERSYPILNLDGWKDQIGNASLAYLLDYLDGKIEVSDWDVSNVEDMEFMCYESKCDADISRWNVGNVKNMASMFSESQFNSDISDWDVSKVEYMDLMFAYSQFNSDISGWDVSKVVNMAGMFAESRFNSDISGWDVGNVENMASMFYFSQFNSDISGWDVGNVENMASMFYNSQFNSDISGWKPSLTPRFDGIFLSYGVENIFFESSISSNLSSWPSFCLDQARVKHLYGLSSDYPDPPTACGSVTIAYGADDSEEADDSAIIIIVAVTAGLLLALIAYRYRFRERLAAAFTPGELLL